MKLVLDGMESVGEGGIIDVVLVDWVAFDAVLCDGNGTIAVVLVNWTGLTSDAVLFCGEEIIAAVLLDSMAFTSDTVLCGGGGGNNCGVG